MDLTTDRIELELARGRLLRVEDALGATVTCQAGTVWVTQDGDPRDVLLAPGERIVLDRPGAGLLQALDAARIVVEPPHGPVRQPARVGSGMRMPRRWYVGTSSAA